MSILARQSALGEIVTPRREKVSPRDYPNLPYIGLENIESHSSRLLGTVPAGQMRSIAHRFRTRDVIYSRLRPYLNKVCRADRDGLCSSEFIVLPENDKIDADFLRYRLNAPDFVSFATHLNAGDRPRVDFDQISVFETWLPASLDEQRGIVAEIEKQFTRLERGVAGLRRVLANLKPPSSKLPAKANSSPPKPNSPAKKVAPTKPAPNFSNASSRRDGRNGRERENTKSQ